MADTKITALTAITTVDPAVDVLPIVDVSDTTMAASGTTKKITSNQILGAGGTATLASATITGNLTLSAGTANGVGYLNASKVLTAGNRLTFATSGFFGTKFDVVSLGSGTNYKGGILLNEDNDGFTLYGGSDYKIIQTEGYSTPSVTKFYASNAEQYRIAPSGVFTWYDGAGGTRMTLNSTGLGIGVAPNRILDVRLDQSALTLARVQNQSTNSAAYAGYQISASGNNWGIWVGSSAANSNALAFVVDPSGTPSVKMTLDTSGNVGVGVTTPSYRLQSAVASGADGNIFAAQVTGASNGFQILWNHATTTTRVIIANIPTSSAGLAAGTLWNDAGTIKIA
jgi:hypothetical protein